MPYVIFFGGGGYVRCSTIVPEESSVFRYDVEQTTANITIILLYTTSTVLETHPLVLKAQRHHLG